MVWGKGGSKEDKEPGSREGERGGELEGAEDLGGRGGGRR